MLAVNAFGYWQLVLLLGVIAVAAGLKRATGHAGDTLPFAEALELAGGVTTFMLGSVLFRRSLRIGSSGWRAAAGAAALVAIPLGTGVAAVAEIAALVVLLATALALEHAPRTRPATALATPEFGSQSAFGQSDPADRISP
jgi:low temperature requirement protein LtrA